jgi:hypothetical protein
MGKGNGRTIQYLGVLCWLVQAGTVCCYVDLQQQIAAVGWAEKAPGSGVALTSF